MKRILSNGPEKDFIIGAMQRLGHRSGSLYLAAPYFDYADIVLDAARRGKRVQLLIGLNSATHPDAVAKALDAPGVVVRYLTTRFHAKIYVFDESALLGSANLTNAGLHANREAVIVLDQDSDHETIEDVRALFAELWEAGAVLTPDIAKQFRSAWQNARRTGPDPDDAIEAAIGAVAPRNIAIESRTLSRERLFLETLRRQVYEQYKPAFEEVSAIVEAEQLRRPELESVGLAFETNRFLNWVRLSKAPGEESWRNAPLRGADERHALVVALGREWRTSPTHHIPAEYLDRIRTVRTHFADAATLGSLSAEEITEGLVSLHAFAEQLRFIEGGLPALGPAFWRENKDDLVRVKRTLHHLLFDAGDFLQRLHDALYDPRWKLNRFGLFCALELFGSVRPDLYPPVNGRMAKALRFLGFDVKGN